MGIQMLLIAASVAVASCSLVNRPPVAKGLAPYHCDETKAEKCYADYAAVIGYTGSGSNATEFEEYVNKYIEDNGRNGFSSLCVADSLLQYCLGAEYDNCTSVRGLTDSGLDQDDAAEYAFFLASEEYYCGKGFDIFYQNFKCFSEVMHSQRNQHEDERCRKTFDDNVSHNHDLFCEYAQEYITCVSNPYKQCGSALAQDYCQSVKASFDKITPRCSYMLSCKDY